MTTASPTERNPLQGDYDKLPDFIRESLTPREWSFLSEREKWQLVRQETEPEF
jgi:hypothetical protein